MGNEEASKRLKLQLPKSGHFGDGEQIMKLALVVGFVF
jgi:hypothetical protein